MVKECKNCEDEPKISQKKNKEKKKRLRHPNLERHSCQNFFRHGNIKPHEHKNNIQCQSL